MDEKRGLGSRKDTKKPIHQCVRISLAGGDVRASSAGKEGKFRGHHRGRCSEARVRCRTGALKLREFLVISLLGTNVRLGHLA